MLSLKSKPQAVGLHNVIYQQVICRPGFSIPKRLLLCAREAGILRFLSLTPISEAECKPEHA